MSPDETVSASALAIRQAILRESRRANRGHIGSALSVAELVAGIVHTLDLSRHPESDRDRFVLSKGHAALAYYVGLQKIGLLGPRALDDFCANGSRLATHPDHEVPGISFSTGSLGLGVSYAAGSALAARLRGSPRRTVALVSDAELNCGLTWEALMFAAHHRLDRLQIVVDLNGSQAFGATRDVLDLSPLAARLEAFGLRVDEIDGHDARQVREALELRAEDAHRPRATLARTKLGHGVSFMAGRLEWHYRQMTADQYRQAMLEVGPSCDERS
jgi:transketolase